MNNISSSGLLTYENVEAVIEKIANYKAYQYGNIGYLEPEDLKQEVRLKCYKELAKFDNTKEKASLFTFFSVCADNRIRDLRRKLVYKNNKPCLRCSHYNAEANKNGKHDCMVFMNKIDCGKYASHHRYIITKINSNRALDITDKNINICDSNYSNQINQIDINEFIGIMLPSGVQNIFEKLVKNNYNPQKLRIKERDELFMILQEIFTKYKEDD